MSHLLGSLKIWQKSLLSLTLCAVVAVGLALQLLASLTTADARYTTLLDRESPAAIWATRMNVSLLDLGRVVWKAVADDVRDQAEEAAEMAQVVRSFAERARGATDKLGSHALAGRAAELQRDFNTLHRVAVEAMRISKERSSIAAIGYLKQSFAEPMARTRQELLAFADAIAQDAEAMSAQSTRIAGEAMGEVAQTNQTVQSLTGSVARISEIQSATGHSVAAIDRINRVIQQINEISLAIASAVEEQGAATQEIARNVAQAAGGTQLVSSNILQVTQASAETGTAASQVQASSAEVAQQAEGLKREVDAFLNQVRAA